MSNIAWVFTICCLFSTSIVLWSLIFDEPEMFVAWLKAALLFLALAFLASVFGG